MKYFYILLFSLTIINFGEAQTKFSKKDWKKMVKTFNQNLNAANNFYQGYVDTKNRDAENGMPQLSIPLHKANRHFFDAANYAAFYTYNFDSEAQALAFLQKLPKKLERKLDKDFKMIVDEDGTIAIEYKEEVEEHPQVFIQQDENTLSFHFNPSLSLPAEWKNEQ